MSLIPVNSHPIVGLEEDAMLDVVTGASVGAEGRRMGSPESGDDTSYRKVMTPKVCV